MNRIIQSKRDTNQKNASMGEAINLPVYSTDPDIGQGKLYYNSDVEKLYVCTDVEWMQVESNVAANCICIGNLIAGSNIDITENIIDGESTFTIFANLTGIVSSLSSSGTGESLVVDGVGPFLVARSILGANGITVSTDSNTIIISANTEVYQGCFVTQCNILSTYPESHILSNGINSTVVTGLDTISVEVNVASFANSTLASVGNGQSLVVEPTGPDLVIRSISGAGSGNNLIDVTTDSNTIIVSANNSLINTCFVTECDVDSIFPNSHVLSNGINSTVLTTSNTIQINIDFVNSTLTSSGNGQSLVVDGVGPDLVVRSIAGNNLISVTTESNTIVISANNNLASACFVTECNNISTFPNSHVLSNGIDTTVLTTSNTIQINVNVSTNDTLSTSGNGQSLVVDGTGPNLVIRSILGNGVSVTTDSNTIIISADLANACFVTTCNITSLFPNSFILTNSVNMTVITTSTNVSLNLNSNLIVNTIIANNVTTNTLIANTAYIDNLNVTNANITNLFVTENTEIYGNVCINCNITTDITVGTNIGVDWVTLPGTVVGGIAGIVSDSNYNVIQGGGYNNSANIYNANLISNVGAASLSTKFLPSVGTGGTGFIIKWDDDGQVVWGVSLAGTDQVAVADVAVDSLDNIYATGRYRANVNVYDASGTSSVFSGKVITINGGGGSNEAWTVKYNSSGISQWITKISVSAGDQEMYGISTDITGNVYVVGFITAASNIFNASGNGAVVSNFFLPAAGSLEASIVKWDTNGQALWGTVIEGTSSDRATTIYVDSNVYIAAETSTTATLFNASGTSSVSSGITVTSLGSTAGVLAKYNTDGQAVWVTKVDGVSAENGLGVVTDAANVYLCGAYSTTANVYSANASSPIFTGIQLTSAGSTGGYLAKFDKNGQAIWATKIDGAGADNAIRTVCDDSGVYVTGAYSASSANVYNANGNTPADTNIRLTGAAGSSYIVKYDHNGQAIWVVKIDSTANDSTKDIYVDDRYNLYNAGQYGPATANIFVVTATTETRIGSMAGISVTGAVIKFGPDITEIIEHDKLDPNVIVEICSDTFIYGNLTVTGQVTTESSYFENLVISNLTLNGTSNGSVTTPVIFDRSVFVTITGRPNLYLIPLIDTDMVI